MTLLIDIWSLAVKLMKKWPQKLVFYLLAQNLYELVASIDGHRPPRDWVQLQDKLEMFAVNVTQYRSNR